MMKYVLVILAATAMSLSAAITTAPRTGPEGNRFLFVVDTSTSMKKVDQGGRQVVYDFIYSGLDERMQPGDTFGVWTFGDEVKGGVYPIQYWTREKSPPLATQAAEFLKAQAAGKISRLDCAITNVEKLIKSVGDVDVIIVTSAATRFKLDDTWEMLQQAWKSRVDEARKNNKPLVVTLAARNRQITQMTVTVGGEPLKLVAPPLRRLAPVTKAAPETDLSRPPASVKPAREPIIMQGGSRPKPIESIPTKFAPQPPAPADPDPLTNPAPEPAPVPVLNPDNPIVNGSKPQLKVSAREPGQPAPTSQAPAGASARMLITAGVMLLLVAGVLGIWILIYVRSRSRVSYISRSMTDKP
jgi:hypothetical protein